MSSVPATGDAMGGKGDVCDAIGRCRHFDKVAAGTPSETRFRELPKAGARNPRLDPRSKSNLPSAGAEQATERDRVQ